MTSPRHHFCETKYTASIAALASILAFIGVVRAEGPGRLLWEADFNDGKTPADWKIVQRVDAMEIRPEKEGSSNKVLVHKADTLVLGMYIPVEQVNCRIEWRAYLDPAQHGDGDADDETEAEAELETPGAGAWEFATAMYLGGEAWSVRSKAGGSRFELTSIQNPQTQESIDVGGLVLIPMPKEAGWHTYALEKVGRELILEFDGKREASDAVLPLSTLGDDPVREVAILLRPGAMIDDVRFYDLSDAVNENPGGLRVGYYPSLKKVLCAVYANLPGVTEARATIRSRGDANAQPIVEKTLPIQRGPLSGQGGWDAQTYDHVIDVPDLADGRYDVIAEVRDAKGQWHEAGREMIQRTHFPWEGNTLGITDEVLPPFTPIEVAGQDVDVVLRKYKLTGLGLIEQVEAKGQDANEDFEPLLASPVVLVANGQALKGKGSFVSQAPNKVIYEGAAQSPAANVSLRNTIEEDGCMKIELTLSPGSKRAALASLALDIPIKDEMAPLWHLGTRRLRANPAGATPKGTGVVWDSRKFKEPDYYGNFHPYYWLGADARGLCWFAENDRGWEVNVNDEDPDQSSPSQEIIRKEGVLTLRVHLVQKPVKLSEPRTIVFGLMATPAKPMPEGWRAIGRKDGQSVLFAMPTMFGIPSGYGGRYPVNADFSTFDFLRDNRLGKREDRTFNEVKDKFINDWIERNLSSHPEMGPEVHKSFRNRLDGGMSRYRDTGERGMVTVYFDELHGTSKFHAEVPVFYSEWNGNGPWLPLTGTRWHNVYYGEPGKDWQWDARWSWGWRIRSDKLPRSYQDFACWYGAEWIKRGVGLYFDNTFPRYVYDPLLSDAYYLPNGKVQPAAGIWAHRDYLRRIWTLHQQFRTPDAPGVMMLHTTNTLIVPYMVWNEADLDLEWKMRFAKMFQQKFSPELLRAETNGLKTGNIPVGMGDIARNYVPAKWYEENKKRYARARDMGFLVHEIKPGITANKMPKLVEDFGYGLPECKVVNYWDDDVPLKVSDDQCKWLLLEWEGRRMIVLCTWNPEDALVTLRFTDKAMTDATDAESNETLPLDDGKLTIPMTGYGSRIILCSENF